MRKVAQALGVTPMALYNHVASKRDLLATVAELILAEARFDEGGDHWRARIESCFRALRAVCIEHPDAARLMEMEGVAPSAAFQPMEITVEALVGAGLNRLNAMCAYFALLSFTLAQASYQTRGPFPDLEPGEALRIKRLSRKLGEVVQEVVPSGGWDFDRAFEYGLSLILNGVEADLDSR